MKVKALLFLLLLPVAGCYKTETYSLRPGEVFIIDNRTVTSFSWEAEYPLNVGEGTCTARLQAIGHLDCPLADSIILNDPRPRFLIWAKSNTVRFRYSIY